MKFNKQALPNGWKTFSLNNVCKNITSGGTPSRSNPSFYENGDICWVKTKELNNTYIFDTEEKITQDALSKSSAKILPRDTILLAMYGATVGELGILSKEMACNQACCALIVDPDIADFKYVYYLLKLYKEDIKGLATGAAQQNLSAKNIKDFEFDFPNLARQKEIISILSSLDDKIQLNTQINQTLEQIAQAIFKSWFIDFDPVKAKAEAKAQGSTDEQANIAAMSVISGKSPDQLNAYQQTNPTDYQQLHQLAQAFPSEFEEIDGVEVPKGWEIVNLSELFEFIGGSQPPKSEHIYEEREGYERFIQNRDYANDNHKTYIPISKRNKRCDEKDILMDKYGEAGKVRFGISGAYNVALAKIEPKKANHREYLRHFFKQEKIKSFLFSASLASTRNSLNSTTFNGMKLTLPCDDLLNSFEKMISLYIDKSLQIKEENFKLEATRDLLLPKLLSGDFTL